MLTNDGSIETYLEVVGEGKPVENSPVFHIAVPTTAGTGAEVTRNAVLGVRDKKVKVSMRSEKMLPDIALIDPELTASMPPELTACTGLDALTQLIEAYVSNKANPMTDALCKKGIPLAAGSLLKAYKDGGDRQARENMSLAALFGGLALANAKLGAVHGFAGPLGGMTSDPHGLICAKFLPAVMAMNIHILTAQKSPMLKRFDSVAKLLTSNPSAKAQDGVTWIKKLCRDLKINKAALTLEESQFPALIEKAARSSSMKGNPVELSNDYLMKILKQILA